MGAKEKKTKEYINSKFKCNECKYEGHCRFGAGYDSSDDCECNADEVAEAFEAGWHAAMEYLYRRPLDVIVEDVIKEVKGE